MSVNDESIITRVEESTMSIKEEIKLLDSTIKAPTGNVVGITKLNYKSHAHKGKRCKSIDPTSTGGGAGVHTGQFNTLERHLAAIQVSNKRTYTPEGEAEREINLKSIETKNFMYYNRMDNLWNESFRLTPNIAKYSHLNVDANSTFKKTVRNLKQIESEEKEEKV